MPISNNVSVSRTPVVKQPTASAQPAANPVVKDSLAQTSLSALPNVAAYTLPTFKNFDEYRRFAESTPLARLPEYQQALTHATAMRSSAQKALVEKKSSIGYDAVEAEYKSALAMQDQVMHPGRERAKELHRQADAIAPQIEKLSNDIVTLQTQISRLQASGNTNAVSDDTTFWGSLASAAVHVAAAAAEGSAISKDMQLIREKQREITRQQIQMSNLESQAVVWEQTAPAPALAADAQSKVDAVQVRLKPLEAQLTSEISTVASAERIFQQASSNVDNLTALKNGLQDTTARFSKVTRIAHPSLKRDVASYWQGK